jgi:hypothetical protein
MVDIAELTWQDTLKLPPDVAARFHPSDRFVVWVEGDTLHLKRITPPPVIPQGDSCPRKRSATSSTRFDAGGEGTDRCAS